jgi:hypothetical protein
MGQTLRTRIRERRKGVNERHLDMKMQGKCFYIRRGFYLPPAFWPVDDPFCQAGRSAVCDEPKNPKHIDREARLSPDMERGLLAMLDVMFPVRRRLVQAA